MPQLDFISFFSQIFWLCLVFVFFYLFVFKNLVPFVSRIIKVRGKKVNKAIAYATFLRRNDIKIAENSTDFLLTKALAAAATLFTVFSTSMHLWVNGEALSFNTKAFSSNKNYLAVLGFIHLQNFIVTYLVFNLRKNFINFRTLGIVSLTRMLLIVERLI
jgi:hypothetical protein